MENQPGNPQAAAVIDSLQKQALDLLTKLTYKQKKVQDKYDYYNADNDIRDFGISSPKNMMNVKPGIGWAGRAVNTLSDRVVFDGFINDRLGINAYFDSIRATTIINKAKHDAFIAGCAFIAIADDIETGGKLLVPFTATEATGILDQKTGLLKCGLAVTKWSDPSIEKGEDKTPISRPLDFIVFTTSYTAVYVNRVLCDIYDNPTKRCLLHPITHRHSADRPLGKSRITNTARRIINEVGRLKRREEIAEEFYSTPQRYINGLAQGAKKDDALDSALGKVWAITKDEDGDKPEIGQLAQMSISQFSEAKKDKARDFCAETSLTLRNLGYETGNPTSAESLASMSDDLLLEAQNSQKEMGEQIKQIAITLRMALDGVDTVSSGLNDLQPAWNPIFQVNIGAAGDAIFKLLEVMPELKGSISSYQMLGIGVREAEKLQALRNTPQNSGFMTGGENV